MNELLIRAWADYFSGMWRLRESQRLYAVELDPARAAHWREEVRERLDRVSTSIQMLYLVDQDIACIQEATRIYYWPLIPDLDQWRERVLPLVLKTPSSFATAKSTSEQFLFAGLDKEIDDFVLRIRLRNGLDGMPEWPVHDPGLIAVRAERAMRHLRSHIF